MKGHTFLRKHRVGFTIIEVSLFLAITALLFVAIATTTRSRIETQRYNEAINDYVEFLHNVYSEVENTQNVAPPSAGRKCTSDSNVDIEKSFSGQSDCAFYGKVIIFGEDGNGNYNKITVADLVGETIEHGESLEKRFDDLSPEVKNLGKSADDIFGSLLAVHAGIYYNPGEFAGNHYEYKISYNYRVENTSGDLYNGTLIIARAPSDNQIHTLWYSGSKNKFSEYEYGSEPTRYTRDFCIDQSDNPSINSPNRRNIRILPEVTDGDAGTGTSSASSVVLIAQDSDGSRPTDENNGYYGNRCK
ncbi:MAG: hypothetical protein Q4F60_01855 [Candidatus Saccharibacteria bacterium]|nr:hypothetical protein [Candidatus Saccharibacteria bacterium]